MALANIIKEVDPPVELTQAEYDALSTAQKNDGTVYFITDGNGAFQTAATTPAEDTSSGTSNVQNELQKKVEKTDVVNNFTTTQEGYVADARALKTIADNYALKTDLTTVTESTSVTLASGIKLYNTEDNVVCYKEGRIVIIRGVLSTTKTLPTTTDEQLLMTLPSGYHPVTTAYSIQHGSGTYLWLMTVRTNGTVYINRYSNGNTVIDVPSGIWLPFTTTFISS